MLGEDLRDRVRRVLGEYELEHPETDTSRSELINVLLEAAVGDEPVDPEPWVYDVLRKPQAIADRLAVHVKCTDCGHRWALQKPMEEYSDGPRCGECMGFDVVVVEDG